MYEIFSIILCNSIKYQALHTTILHISLFQEQVPFWRFENSTTIFSILSDWILSGSNLTGLIYIKLWISIKKFHTKLGTKAERTLFKEHFASKYVSVMWCVFSIFSDQFLYSNMWCIFSQSQVEPGYLLLT